jgi:NAD(P)H-hydrate epimerase
MPGSAAYNRMRLVEGLPYVTADEMRRIDEAAIGDYGIDVLSLMENAGRVTAVLARRLLGGTVAQRRVACLTGKGNNGGDGLVASRHLRNWGADVTVFLSVPKEGLGDIAARQLNSIEAMGIPVLGRGADMSGFDILLDALLGYNARGSPRENVAALIRSANVTGTPILAIDIPSGLDPTTGEPGEPCIVAKATLALGFPKTGFLSAASRKWLGELYVGDVSIPRSIYVDIAQASSLFKDDQIVRIW